MTMTLIHIKHTQPKWYQQSWSGDVVRSLYLRDLIAHIACSAYDVKLVDSYLVRPWEKCAGVNMRFKWRMIPLGALFKGLNLTCIKTMYPKLYPLMLETSLKGILKLIENMENKPLVVIDHVYSLMAVRKSFKELKKYATVIYVSHDFEPEFFTSALNVPKALSNYYENVVHSTLGHVDLIVAASLRDKFKYPHNESIKNIAVYPNVYPPMDFLLERKSDYVREVEKSRSLTIAYVPTSNKTVPQIMARVKELAWALKESRLTSRILCISETEHKLKVNGVEVTLTGKIPKREDYLKLLATAHIGFNETRAICGTNIKRFDYALAGLYVVNGSYGARGEPLPFETTVIDKEDMAVKFKYLFSNLSMLERQGLENYKSAITMALNGLKELSDALDKFVGHVT